MRLLYRVHGWLADRLPWVQYPRERDARFSRHSMSPSKVVLTTDMRIGIGLMSFFWIVVLVVVLAAMLAFLVALL